MEFISDSNEPADYQPKPYLIWIIFFDGIVPSHARGRSLTFLMFYMHDYIV